MSQSMKGPMDSSLCELLKCKLPDDYLVQKVETELLKKLGFSEDFVKLFGETRNPKQQTLIGNANSGFTEYALNINAAPKPSEATVTDNSTETNYVKPSSERQNPVLSNSARELLEKATSFYRSGQFQDSLIHINQALDVTERFDENVMLLTFKTTVLNAMEDYTGTLRSVQDVPYRLRSSHLTLEGAKALEKLNLLFTAEEWLKKTLQIRGEETEINGGKQTVQRLFQDVRLRRIYQPLIQGAPIKISLSKTGRAVLAARIIAKGEIIFSEVPEFLEQSLASQSITVCSHCGSILLRPEDVLPAEQRIPPDVKKAVKKYWQTGVTTPCQGCSRVVYCSESCRQEAWLSYHKDICPSSPNSPATVLYDVRDSFREVKDTNGRSWQGWWNADFSPLLLARLWATVLAEAKLRAGNQTMLNYEDVLGPIFSKILKYSINSDISECTRVPRMFDCMKNIFKRAKFLGYEITETEFDQMYHRVSTNFISFCDVNNPVKEFLDRIQNNQKVLKKIVKFMREPVQKMELHGLFPLASCINHSCLPNAEIVSRAVEGKPGVAITAKRDIPKMEEVTIAYVDPQLSRRERRDMLFRRYTFWCQCLRCQFEGDGPDMCTQCGKHPQTYIRDRPSEINEDSIESLPDFSVVRDTNVLQMSSAVQDTNVLQMSSAGQDKNVVQNSTENLQFSQFKIGELLDPNYRQKKHRESHEVNHYEDFNTESRKGEDNLEFRTPVKDKCSFDSQENCDLNNASNNISYQHDVSRESLEKESNSESEEIATQPQRAESLRSVNVLDDKMNLTCGSGSENQSLTKYPHCGRCCRAWYCSQKCQKEAWKKGHKHICAKV